MNPIKYAAKLRKMSKEELSFRVLQKARNKRECLRCKMHKNSDLGSLLVPSWISKWNVDEDTFPAKPIRFFGMADSYDTLRTTYKERFPDALHSCINRAGNLEGHRFQLLGLEANLPNPILWNRNPISGKDFPRIHHSLIDTGNPEPYGDVKFVWELNRHQFFIEMGKAYFLTGEEKYAVKIDEWFRGWVAETPYKMGVNNTSVLEHSVRIFSWIWTYYFTKDSKIWTPDLIKLFTKNLLLQGALIEENLSYFYSPYNHLIGELAALAFLGIFWEKDSRPKKWGEKYWQELERQIEIQFHTDGFTVEQASYYHHFTWGFYLMVALLRKQNRLSVSTQVLKRMEKAMEFSMYLTRPDGLLPMYGDIDSARSIYFYPPDPMWNLRPFLAIAATLFGRGDMKETSGGICEEILWLFGKKGVDEFEGLESKKIAAHSKPFYESGYFIMRDGWQGTSNYCSFDCGPIAHGVFKDGTPSAAHGHADILSFEMCINGKPLVIDPGFHTYFGSLDWHRNFRATRGHNVIEVNGAGQAIHEGRISWSQVSSPQLDHWVNTPDYDFVGGKIDRFAKSILNVIHRRYILFRKGFYFLVMDEIGTGSTSDDPQSTRPLEIESSLHFAPGRVSIKQNLLYFNEQPHVAFSLPKEALVSVNCGGQNSDEGWIAEGYGVKTAAPVVRIKTKQKIPVYLAMLFPVGNQGESKIEVVRGEMSNSITLYHVYRGDYHEKIYLNPNRNIFTYCDDSITTDALCLIEPGLGEKKNFHWAFKVNMLKSEAYNLNVEKESDQGENLKFQLGKSNNSTVEFFT